MYEAFYGLHSKPFALQPHADFLYPSRQQRIARHLLDYALQSGAPFTVVSGETGTGKTTLVRELVENLDRRFQVGIVAGAAPNSFGELLQWILAAFELQAEAQGSIALQQLFLAHLQNIEAAQKRALLVIDEAQHLHGGLLEELRMLTNVNLDDRCLLQVLLVGQPTLRETLRRPELRQLAQRVTVDYTLAPLEQAETEAYIRHRLKCAGSAEAVFDAAACSEVHELSGGIPRLVNLICDLALVYGYAEGCRSIAVDLIRELANDKLKQGGWLFAPSASALPVPTLSRVG